MALPVVRFIYTMALTVGLIVPMWHIFIGYSSRHYRRYSLALSTALRRTYSLRDSLERCAASLSIRSSVGLNRILSTLILLVVVSGVSLIVECL